jgi:hypothetical protein
MNSDPSDCSIVGCRTVGDEQRFWTVFDRDTSLTMETTLPGLAGKTLFAYLALANRYIRGSTFSARIGIREKMGRPCLCILGFTRMELLGYTFREAHDAIKSEMVRLGIRGQWSAETPTSDEYNRYIGLLHPDRSHMDFARLMCAASAML